MNPKLIERKPNDTFVFEVPQSASVPTKTTELTLAQISANRNKFTKHVTTLERQLAEAETKKAEAEAMYTLATT